MIDLQNTFTLEQSTKNIWHCKSFRCCLEPVIQAIVHKQTSVYASELKQNSCGYKFILCKQKPDRLPLINQHAIVDYLRLSFVINTHSWNSFSCLFAGFVRD